MDEQEQVIEIDPKVHEAVATILSKDPSELTPADKAFLRARQSYLGRNARKKFADVLAEENPPVEEKKVEEPKEVDLSQHPADQEDEE